MERQPHFCLECFALIAAEAQTCPICGRDQAQLRARDYHAKLLHALHHPLSEVRMRAIIALGLRGEPDAAQALADCALRHPVDVVEGLEIVRSLRLLQARSGRLEALENLARRHPAQAVRAAAARALADSSGEAEPHRLGDHGAHGATSTEKSAHENSSTDSKR